MNQEQKEQTARTPKVRTEPRRRSTVIRSPSQSLLEIRSWQTALIAVTVAGVFVSSLILLFGDGVMRRDDNHPNSPDPSTERPFDTLDNLNCDNMAKDIRNIFRVAVQDAAVLEAISALIKKSSESSAPDPLLECATRLTKILTTAADTDKGLARIIEAYVEAERCETARDLVDNLYNTEQRDFQSKYIATRCFGK